MKINAKNGRLTILSSSELKGLTLKLNVGIGKAKVTVAF